MESKLRASLRGLKIFSFESRRAQEMAELIRRYGGEPWVVPSMREIPLSDNEAALDLLPALERKEVDFLILTTGAGTRAMNEALLTRYPQERIAAALRKTKLIVRGGKAAGALKALGLEPELTAPEPNTWREVLSTLQAVAKVRGKRIAIQEYGVVNEELTAALESHGAVALSISIYRWALPEDAAPLRGAVAKILAGAADVALFTNGAQADHLFKVAEADRAAVALRSALQRMVVGSVGPVCTRALHRLGLEADIEPPHPKMGALVGAMAASAVAILTAKRGV